MQLVLMSFEEFLSSIPLDRYREELLTVKTVEQDLPKALNPLPDIYSNYWVSEVRQFPNYDEFFDNWWRDHQNQINEFKNKYFWGCSCEFVRLGFKARLYRTLISVLTQFHFSYTWLANCQMPLYTSAEIDMKGIDAVIQPKEGITIALQIKKETYRKEARGKGVFVEKGKKAKMVIEVPYTITTPEEWHKLEEAARKEATKKRYSLFRWLSSALQRRLSNGFIVFEPLYPRLVERYIAQRKDNLPVSDMVTVSWDALLDAIMKLADEPF